MPTGASAPTRHRRTRLQRFVKIALRPVPTQPTFANTSRSHTLFLLAPRRRLGTSLEEQQQATISTLLLAPEMLPELSDVRRKLSRALSEAEGLRVELRKLTERRRLARPAEWLPIAPDESPAHPLRTRCASAEAERMEARTLLAGAAARGGGEGGGEGGGGSASTEHELGSLKLQVRLMRGHWNNCRRTAARQGLLLRQLSAQRNEELERAATQAEVLRRTQAQVHELLIEQETWRVQSTQQADVIAAAMTASASTQGQHAEEVALLTEKLRQLLEEKAGLQALADSQSADLKLMSSEMVRLMTLDGMASS